MGATTCTSQCMLRYVMSQIRNSHMCCLLAYSLGVVRDPIGCYWSQSPITLLASYYIISPAVHLEPHWNLFERLFGFVVQLVLFTCIVRAPLRHCLVYFPLYIWIVGLAIVRLSAVLSQDSTGEPKQLAHKPDWIIYLYPYKLSLLFSSLFVPF